MNAAERNSGLAPPTARSLTVPCTARLPMSPPGKNGGRTTKESVVNASRVPLVSVSVAWSSRPSSVLLAKPRKEDFAGSDRC